MPYITIESAEYMVRVGQGRGRTIQAEVRRRAIDGSLLVDPIASKREVTVEITGDADTGTFFTPEEADYLIDVLTSGPVSVSGDVGTFTAIARDVAWLDGQDHTGGQPTVYRWVTCTLEEV